MFFEGQASPEHIKRERKKAQELRKGSWWKQQLGLGVCYHCKQRFSKEELTMDHLIPLARGGKSTKKNLVVSCKDCNRDKGHKLSVEITMEKMERPTSGSESDSESE
jgi:5-methylcytosine-specific restriction protein A